MCGRYSLQNQAWLASLLGVEIGDLPHALRAPRYNVAPGQMVLTLVRGTSGNVAESMHWGVEAPWQGGPSQLINARAEKLNQSPFWRKLLENGRCVIPADGFYEWRSLGGGRKQPYWFSRTGAAGFGLAGLRAETGDGHSACVVITVEPNELVAGVHDRMPAMLDEEGIAAWLGDDLELALAALKPFPSIAMNARSVGTMVNNANREGPELIEPAAQAQPDQTLF